MLAGGVGIVTSMNYGELHLSTEWLRRADAVAKAVDLWVRRWALERLCASNEPGPADKTGFAAGLLEGLTLSMELEERELQAAAYAYCLLSQTGEDTVVAARQLLTAADDPELSVSYLDGLGESQRLSLFVRMSGRHATDKRGVAGSRRSIQ